MSLTGLEKAILLSISYSNVFSTALSSKEVWLRLITKKEVSLKKIELLLDSLVEINYLTKISGYYSIRENNFTSLRNKRKEYSQDKLKEANSLINKAKLIPFIKAIVVTGSLSVSNAKKNDDVDWLIITSKNTLWLTRPLLIILANFYGKRRERNGNHRDNSWCFNMFMTEESLAISKKKRNLYTAYEVCQAKFVYDRSNLEERFLNNNKWVKRYLNNYFDFKLGKVIFSKNKDKKKKKGIEKDYNYIGEDSIVISILNNLFFYMQYFYMKKRITREVVKKDKAFFHPRDTKKEIFKQWKSILQSKFLSNY